MVDNLSLMLSSFDINTLVLWAIQGILTSFFHINVLIVESFEPFPCLKELSKVFGSLHSSMNYCTFVNCYVVPLHFTKPACSWGIFHCKKLFRRCRVLCNISTIVIFLTGPFLMWGTNPIIWLLSGLQYLIAYFSIIY